MSERIAPRIADFGAVWTIGEWYGYYPTIRSEEGWCNGGIPQLANVSAHMAQLWKDFAEEGLNSSFTGHIVFDFEDWHPVWNMTPLLYRNASKNLTKLRHTSIAHDPFLVEQTAMAEYQNASLLFFLASVTAVQLHMPYVATIGFYGFPDVFGYWVNASAAPLFNDGVLLPLWRVVTGFHPSLYLPYKSNVDVPYARNQLYIDQVLAENVRLRQKLSVAFAHPVWIAPYAWYRYHPGEPHGMQFLDRNDTALEFRYPFGASSAVPRIDALIIWGDGMENASIVPEIEAYFLSNRATFQGTADSSAQPSADRDGSLPAPRHRLQKDVAVPPLPSSEAGIAALRRHATSVGIVWPRPSPFSQPAGGGGWVPPPWTTCDLQMPWHA